MIAGCKTTAGKGICMSRRTQYGAEKWRKENARKKKKEEKKKKRMEKAAMNKEESERLPENEQSSDAENNG